LSILKAWLAPIDAYNDIYERRQENRLEKTCEWAYDIPAISNWMEPTDTPLSALALSSPQSVFVCGKAGSGKSVLGVYIYDQIASRIQKANWTATDVSRCRGAPDSSDCQQQSMEQNKAVLYFALDKDSNAKVAIGTLIHQLLGYQPRRKAAHQIVQDVKMASKASTVTVGAGLSILLQLLPLFPLVK
jgi:hypothetical protein